MSDNKSDRETEYAPRQMYSKMQFAAGGNPQSRHAPTRSEVKVDAGDLDRLSLMMVQALEGRA